MPVDDIPAMRAALVAANRAADETPPARVRRGHEEQIGNVHGFPVHTLWKSTGLSGDEPDRSLVYLHGGAYVKPTDPRHWRFAVALADALGARAVLPTYPWLRSSPSTTRSTSWSCSSRRWRRSHREGSCWPATRRVVATHSRWPRRCVTAEDRSRTDWCCIAPWVDLTGTTPGTIEAAGRDPWLSFPHCRSTPRSGRAPTTPRRSPTRE